MSEKDETLYLRIEYKIDPPEGVDLKKMPGLAAMSDLRRHVSDVLKGRGFAVTLRDKRGRAVASFTRCYVAALLAHDIGAAILAAKGWTGDPNKPVGDGLVWVEGAGVVDVSGPEPVHVKFEP